MTSSNLRKHRDYHEKHVVWPEELSQCNYCDAEYEAEHEAQHKAQLDAAVAAEKERCANEAKRFLDGIAMSEGAFVMPGHLGLLTAAAIRTEGEDK